MNFNFYIFGNPQAYSQYPQDYTKDIFFPVCKNLEGARGVIYRDNALVYYIFAESLGDGRYIGLCLIFNNAQATKPKNLFNFMREVIESYAVKGDRYLKYNAQGKIEFTTSDFCYELKSYEYLKSVIGSKLAGDNNFDISPLTSNYSGENKTETLASSATSSEMLRLSNRINRVVIDDSVGISHDSTNKLIVSLREDINKRDDTIRELKKTVSELEKQKKQYRRVVFLFLVLLVALGGVYLLYLSLNETQISLRKKTEQYDAAVVSIDSLGSEITMRENEMSSLRGQIDVKNNHISELEESLAQEKRLREEAEQRAEQKAKTTGKLTIVDGSLDFGAARYRYTYNSPTSGYRRVKIKIIEESSGKVVNSGDLSEYYNEGQGTSSINLNCSLTSSKWYTIELWEGNRLIGGTRH